MFPRPFWGCINVSVRDVSASQLRHESNILSFLLPFTCEFELKRRLYVWDAFTSWARLLRTVYIMFSVVTYFFNVIVVYKGLKNEDMLCKKTSLKYHYVYTTRSSILESSRDASNTIDIIKYHRHETTNPTITMKLIWRTDTHRFYLRMPYLQMSCIDLRTLQGVRIVAPKVPYSFPVCWLTMITLLMRKCDHILIWYCCFEIICKHVTINADHLNKRYHSCMQLCE